MPLKYKIFPDLKVAYVSGCGHVCIDDLLQHLDSLSENPEYRVPMKKLLDLSTVALLGLSKEDIERFTTRKIQLSERFTGERCAVVVTKDYDFGMMRIHEALLSFETNIVTSVFRNLQGAMEFLEVNINVYRLQI